LLSTASAPCKQLIVLASKSHTSQLPVVLPHSSAAHQLSSTAIEDNGFDLTPSEPSVQHITVPADEPQAGPKGRRYALCFFGLTRSLNWTIGSIEDHIFAPLDAAADSSDGPVSYDIFLHTYRVATISNHRAEEKAAPYTHLQDYRLLHPTRYVMFYMYRQHCELLSNQTGLCRVVCIINTL
jgi:hypothetical protein